MTQNDKRHQPNASTVTVRIAVAVAGEDAWSAAGNCAYCRDEEALDAAADGLGGQGDGDRRLVFVTVDVPVPQRSWHVLPGAVGPMVGA